MNKFKVGDLAFSLRAGWGVIAFSNSERYPVCHRSETYTKEGRHNTDDTYPSLLTIEEAAKLGHKPPKEMLPKEEYYQWRYQHKATMNWQIDSVPLTKKQAQKGFEEAGTYNYEIHVGPFYPGDGEK